MEEDLQKKAAQSALRLWHINGTIFSAFPHYLAGSGADAMGTMPGISLHTELELLVRLGLSPREALAAATNNYAIQFGWNELGLIVPGRRADILVVDADPRLASGTPAASRPFSSTANPSTATPSSISKSSSAASFASLAPLTR